MMRPTLLATSLAILCLTGCGFDFGTEPTSSPLAVEPGPDGGLPPGSFFLDGGTGFPTTGGNCVFVACSDPYGVGCGVVCSE